MQRSSEEMCAPLRKLIEQLKKAAGDFGDISIVPIAIPFGDRSSNSWQKTAKRKMGAPSSQSLLCASYYPYFSLSDDGN